MVLDAPLACDLPSFLPIHHSNFSEPSCVCSFFCCPTFGSCFPCEREFFTCMRWDLWNFQPKYFLSFSWATSLLGGPCVFPAVFCAQSSVGLIASKSPLDVRGWIVAGIVPAARDYHKISDMVLSNYLFRDKCNFIHL